MGELLHSVGGARFLRSKEIGFNYDKKMGFGVMRNNFRLHENSFKGKSENIWGHRSVEISNLRKFLALINEAIALLKTIPLYLINLLPTTYQSHLVLLSPQLKKKKKKRKEKLRTNEKNISTRKKNRKEIITRDVPPLKKHNYTQGTQSHVLIFYLIRCWNWTTCILSKRDKTIRNCGVKTALYLKRNTEN